MAVTHLSAGSPGRVKYRTYVAAWIPRLLAFLCLCFVSRAWGEVGGGPSFQTDLEAVVRPESRVLGTPGYEATERWLEGQIRALPGVDLRVHRFPVMVPVTDEAGVSLPWGTVEKVYPFWPAGVRPNSTPAGGITGRLVYVGEGRLDQIRPAELAGQIAVIEASAGERWQQAAYFGARAILVLGRAETTYADLRSHDVLVPVNVPRFYVPPGEFADALRKGQTGGQATVQARVSWKKVMACNLYALVMRRGGTGATNEGGGESAGAVSGALTFSVPFDSSGLVPDLAKGAGQGVQTAAGLQILRQVAAQPWDRPVMVCFTGGDSMSLMATRQMFMALSDVPRMWRGPLGELAGKRAEVEQALARIRAVREDPRSLRINDDRAVIDRIVKIIETDAALEQDELFRLRTAREGEQSEATAARRKVLEDRQVTLSRLRFAFQSHPERLDPAVARPYIDRAIERLERLIGQYDERRQQLQERVDLYQWLAGRLGKDKNPGDRANDNRLIELLVALDFSDAGVRCGPLYYGQFEQHSNISQIQDQRDWFSRIERTYADRTTREQVAWFGPIRPWVDFDPFTGIRAPQTWLCAPLALPTEMCQAWATPGFTFGTLDDLRLRRDTPTDRPENLDLAAILPQFRATVDLFHHAWNDPRFVSRMGGLKWQRTDLVGQVVSPSPNNPIPDLPREGFLATYYYAMTPPTRVPKLRPIPWTLGMRRIEVQDSDAEGFYHFEGLPRLNPDLQQLAVEVYRVEAGTGKITGSSDIGKQSEDIRLYADIRFDQLPMRSLVFNCAEMSLVGLYDPRFLQDLTDVLLLDARRNAEPQRFNVLLHQQLMSACVEPEVSSYLIFRYGRIGNRLLLLNMQDPSSTVRRAGMRDVLDLARGFRVDQVNSLKPLSLVTATDFHRADDVRLSEYRKAGVSSSLLDDLHAQAGKQIQQAAAVYPGEQTLDLVQHPAAVERWLSNARAPTAERLVKDANGAWANEARVYAAAQDMANDVVYAAIFLLLLCVPFSFCMERLLVGTPNVYKQIAGAAVIFAIMTAALWSFHPAFKISTSPLIIVLAFAIIFMSLVVMVVVYGKFDTELKKIRSGRGTAEGASIARASVLMSAVVLGIANMRRRRFRTALTSITVVLITFAVLCFTSATRYLDTTTLPTGVATSHSGVMLRQRGFRAMPALTTENLRCVLGDRLDLVERWWNVNANDPKDNVQVAAEPRGGAAPKIFAAQAVLGLSPGESRLCKIADVIGPEKFARLEKGEERIIYFSRSVAEQLGMREGDHVKVGGLDLQVAGLFDATDFDRRVLMLSGEPLAPLRYSTGMIDAGGRMMNDSAADSLDLDASASAGEAGANYEHLSSAEIIIVPAAISKILPNASLRTVGIRLADEKEVKAVSDELSRRFAIALFAGFDDGVKMVSASNLASVSGAGQVAIPLAIAGLIIFNTMMGSIAERRREIHVYTSLGLAPMHVGALFVAEAMTYGLIGTVFGYVVGQGVGTLLLHLGWLGNVTLNYSGTSAIMTMGLILLIVLLSALVPARLASKIAAPSIERSWRVPLPKGDEIFAHLPFTINRTAAEGALAYLAEFFDAHREGSIGKFSAGKVETFTFDDEHGQKSRGIKTTIWLTPFDLGVRQHLMLLIHPGQFQDIYEVQVILQRLSGDDGSWYRMNKTFLTELRKQFLQWRSLSPQRMLEYIDESHRRFTDGTATAGAAAPAVAIPGPIAPGEGLPA